MESSRTGKERKKERNEKITFKKIFRKSKESEK